MVRVKVFVEKSSYGYSAYMAEGDDALEYGLIGEGKTVAEAIEDFKASYEAMKEHFAMEGKHFTDAEFEFYNDIPSFLQQYAYILTLSGLERITGVNQRQLGHYISGYRNPSQKTKQKIVDGIRKFGKELAAVKFA